MLDIKIAIGHEQTIDAILLVIKSTDYRISVQETIAIKACVKFFTNFSPKHVFLVITHCDQQMPTDEFIEEKLEMFKQYGPLDIPRENVVKFNYTAESLAPMLEIMENSSMKVVPDVDKKALEVVKELEGDFKRQDKELGTKNFEEFQMFKELVLASIESSRQLVAEMSKQLMGLTS